MGVRTAMALPELYIVLEACCIQNRYGYPPEAVDLFFDRDVT